MIRSMTGFGTATVSTSLGEITVEVKSLNNRFLDTTVKLPRELSAAEPRVREEVRRRLRRGKVELYVRWTPAPGSQALYEINGALLRHYARQVREALAEESAVGSGQPSEIPGGQMEIELGALLSLPGVVIPARAAAEDGPLAEGALEAVRNALEALDRTRAEEGRALADAISASLDEIASLREEIMAAKDQLLEEYRTRLIDRLETLQRTIAPALDPARAEAEAVVYAEKCDITEELVRLEVHLGACRKLLDPGHPEPAGKSLDFLVQELLRESNTIGNKARGAAVAARVVAMKGEIEKIREQVQNLE